MKYSRIYTSIIISFLVSSCIKTNCISNKYHLTIEKTQGKKIKKVFHNCICSCDFDKLYPNFSKIDSLSELSATIDLDIEIKDNKSCDGIYFYRLFYDYLRIPTRFHDSKGSYHIYWYFIILDGNLITFRNNKDNKLIFEKYEKQLKEKFGKKIIQEIRSDIIKGIVIIR